MLFLCIECVYEKNLIEFKLSTVNLVKANRFNNFWILIYRCGRDFLSYNVDKLIILHKKKFFQLSFKSPWSTKISHTLGIRGVVGIVVLITVKYALKEIFSWAAKNRVGVKPPK